MLKLTGDFVYTDLRDRHDITWGNPHDIQEKYLVIK